MKEAQDKLAAAEEASKKAAEEAKKKARELKTAVGLARTIGPQIPSFVTHRGIGAFCPEDFAKVSTKKSNGNQSKEEDNYAGDQEDKSDDSVREKNSDILPTDLNNKDGRLDEEKETGSEVQGFEDGGTESTK